jgi:hypothetical protein
LGDLGIVIPFSLLLFDFGDGRELDLDIILGSVTLALVFLLPGLTLEVANPMRGLILDLWERDRCEIVESKVDRESLSF